MIDINYLYNAGSISQDLSSISVRMMMTGAKVYERVLSNCRIENQTLFADDVFDVPERFDAVRIMSGNDQISEIQQIKISTDHADGDNYMLLWSRNGICKV